MEMEIIPGKFKEMMMDNDDDDDDESDKISQAFICCVCRDLLYKPVVLACGHVSCFWCVHKSMSGLHKSRCPICRNQYYHFPSVCETLHFLLLKMHPTTYKTREKHTLEEEKERGYFSPQLDFPAYRLQPEETITQPRFSEADPSVNPSSSKTRETIERVANVESGSVHQEISSSSFENHGEDIAATCVSSIKSLDQKVHNDGNCKQVSVEDVLCGSCKHMLFRPIVLNCGHVFCSCCIVPHTNEMLICEVCQCPHPGEIPKVCLEFDHFLEEQFPKEYGLRSGTSQMKQQQLLSDTPNTCLSESGKENFHFSFASGEEPSHWWNTSSRVHIGVGCDCCGMYPIIGDRYRCKDCLEQIGYDLCNDCYTTRSKLPGRFNQQHTSDHEFEIMKSNDIENIMLRLLRGQLQEVSAVSDALRDGSGDVIPSLSDDTNEDDDTIVDPPLSSSEARPNQSDNQRSA